MLFPCVFKKTALPVPETLANLFGGDQMFVRQLSAHREGDDKHWSPQSRIEIVYLKDILKQYSEANIPGLLSRELSSKA
jgi:hypothetical protein